MLYELGGPVRYTYWPVSGLIAFVATTENAEAISVAIVGAHGIVGVPPLAPTHGSPYEVVVQLDCEAYRFPSEAVLHEFRRAEDLHRVILQHADALLRVVVQSALCHAYHSLPQRVCRWLLSTRDCVGSDVIELTQESIAYLLGLSRPRVSTALADLEDKGFIRQRHGRIRVVSPRGLADCSCECYRVLKDGTRAESRVAMSTQTPTR
jgi:CRP-like cAMP-binding protein